MCDLFFYTFNKEIKTIYHYFINKLKKGEISWQVEYQDII